ncbi:MAG TPA: histidine kinase dimerization/phosphoacceptor domain -containing protein, partial [Spirochaetales bacterium]|nr:histidine kinase dimerization/phosphoacceptor domain -containing protein [Spirochaetales bacterium]
MADRRKVIVSRIAGRLAGAAPLFISLAGMVLTLILFLSLQGSRQEALEQSFRHDAASHAQLIAAAMEMRLNEIQALARFFMGSAVVSKEEFSEFVQPWLGFGKFQGLAWMPTLEYPAGVVGLPYVELSRTADQAALQTFLRSPETSVAVEQSMLSDMPVASRPHPDGDVAYMTIALSVGNKDGSGGTILGIMEIHDLLESELIYGSSKSINLVVRDASQSGAPVIHDHKALYGKVPRPSSALGRLLFLHHHDFAGRNLIFEFRPSTDYLPGIDVSPWFTLASGLALSTFLGLYLRSLSMGLGSAEKKARQLTEEFELYFSTALDMFAIADTDGHFLKLNPQWEVALGWPVATLQGSLFLDYVHPDDIERTKAAVSQLSNRETVVDFVNRYRTASGDYRMIEWRSVTGPDGKTIYAAARDISERIRMEDSMRKSLREKEALLKEVHHRVKNNLQIISSMLDLQTAKDSSPAFAAAVEEAQGRIRTMALIHEQLYRQGDFASINFGLYADELASSLVRDFARRPVALSVDVRDFTLDLSSAISCGLALNELVTNAIKYGVPENAKARIAITAFRREDECVLRVSDNGPGLDPALFEKP